MEIQNQAPLPNGVAATTTFNGIALSVPEPETREVQLPHSKLKAQIRRGKGRDLRVAQMRSSQDASLFVPTLISLLVTVNGQPVIPEFFDDMDIDDASLLQSEVLPKGFLPQVPEKSEL